MFYAQWHHHLYQSWWRVIEYSWSSCFAFSHLHRRTHHCWSSITCQRVWVSALLLPLEGRLLFLSSVFSYSAEIFTTSVQAFGRGGASGLGGGGASGLALELFEGGVGILMIAVVTSPLLLQFRLPDSSDIRLRLERLRQREKERKRQRTFRTLFSYSHLFI